MSKIGPQIEFAILDVKRGREDIRRAIEAGREVVVTAQIKLNTAHKNDDGISQEFSGEVNLMRTEIL